VSLLQRLVPLFADHVEQRRIEVAIAQGIVQHRFVRRIGESGDDVGARRIENLPRGAASADRYGEQIQIGRSLREAHFQ
jgi:hypothetical protein